MRTLLKTQLPDLAGQLQALLALWVEGTLLRPTVAMGSKLVVLVISVVYRQHAIPVAWHIVGTQERESWIDHFLPPAAAFGPGCAGYGAGTHAL